jgi:hypothetical protein
MAYRIQLNPAVFNATPPINPKFAKFSGLSPQKAKIYLGSQEIGGGQPVTDGAGLVPYNENHYVLRIDSIGLIMEDEAFRRLGIAQWRFQMAELVRKGILLIDSTPGAAATYLTVDEVMQLWSRNP